MAASKNNRNQKGWGGEKCYTTHLPRWTVPPRTTPAPSHPPAAPAAPPHPTHNRAGSNAVPALQRGTLRDARRTPTPHIYGGNVPTTSPRYSCCTRGYPGSWTGGNNHAAAPRLHFTGLLAPLLLLPVQFCPVTIPLHCALHLRTTDSLRLCKLYGCSTRLLMVGCTLVPSPQETGVPRSKRKIAAFMWWGRREDG